MIPSLHLLETDVLLDSVQHHAMIAWYESHPTKEAYRLALNEVQSRMLAMPQAEMETSHHFINGVYARTMRVKAGTVVIGKLHKGESLNIMVAGDMTLVTEDGVKRIKSGHIETSQAGTKRFAIAHQDTTWTQIIKTELTDPDEIKKNFTADDYAEIETNGDIL